MTRKDFDLPTPEIFVYTAEEVAKIAVVKPRERFISVHDVNKRVSFQRETYEALFKRLPVVMRVSAAGLRVYRTLSDNITLVWGDIEELKD